MGYFGCESEVPMLLYRRWWFDFDFIASEQLIGDRIIGNKENTDILEYIAGIRSKIITYSDMKELINTIARELEAGNPILGFVDGYYSPWDIHYHKMHSDHAVIIIGIDLDKEIVFCSDRYYSNKIESVSFSNLSKWIQQCVCYHAVARSRRLSLDESNYLIFSHMKDMMENKVFEKIRSFAEYVKTRIDIEKEFFSFDNFEKTPFVIALNDLGYGRESFSRTLGFIKDKYRKYELDYFIDNFEQIGRRWRDLGLLICKYIATNNKHFNIEKMAQNIVGIAHKEEVLFDELYGYLNGSIKIETPVFKEYDWTLDKGEIIQLDISNIMNNRAFAQKIDNNEKANFNDSDEFMVLQSKLADHSIRCNDVMLEVSIVRFSHKLAFELTDVYDVKYTARVGATTNQIIGEECQNNFVIKDIQEINLDNFDAFILGHCDEVFNVTKTENKKAKLIQRLVKEGKYIYSFDDISDYLMECSEYRKHLCFFPSVLQNNKYIAPFGKLYRQDKPVLGIFGTSSHQGKFTLQLKIRYNLIDKQYNICQIGTEPSSLLFGMDGIFINGYNSGEILKQYDVIAYLNRLIFDLSRQSDLIIVGGQSGLVLRDEGNLSNYFFKQIDYLFATLPDAVVLCVNTFDDFIIIERAIKFIESSVDCKVIALSVYPFYFEDNDIYHQRLRHMSLELFRAKYKPIFENNIGLPVFYPEDEMEIEHLCEMILNYFQE